ncbi:polyhydroxyalkanoate synthesis repressor PhaR [Rhodospirillaceae bacterium KN72]|uniref:Polyhydroxyalkanoate synthesis repressor PhaR n=1 Tax=Pacificispira spongiicola TaxID=2729598 RepID=A0A7Y0E1F2_9PROT|nr:polyhydroxyalkanoate synthesis repressor PhaR [Pacificispira spongiicola]NMM45431.1 polyhydroxyalkanoate synthesis repressor PhaR [Pacificispira spongiicola]
MSQEKPANGKTESVAPEEAKTGEASTAQPITIKKYANRRLYNTATSSYVTLDHLSQMVREGIDFAVFDAKTGEDITRAVLTQIIVEEEAKNGQNLLPVSFLRSLIGFYGDNMHSMMLPKYLDMSIRSFTDNQEKMREYVQGTFGTVFPFGPLEELGKQNMAMFERAMQMFSPFAGEGEKPVPGKASDTSESTASGGGEDKVEALERQLEEMQKQIKAMRGSKG